MNSFAKTVQAASKELKITQTGVTQRIRALESQLKATLFTRSRRGMILTHEGEALLRYCQTVKDLEGETLSQIQESGKTSEVRVAINGPTSIMRTRIIPQCLSVLKNFGELSIQFQISDGVSGADQLRMGLVQFAILAPEEVAREMDSKLLKAEQYVLVGPKKWKNRNLKEMIESERIIDFEPSDQTSFSYLKKFHLLKYVKRERHFVNNNESLVEMFERELGYGVLTKEFAELYLRRSGIALLNNEQTLENRLALAWYPRPNPAPYFKAIVATIH
jgi:DNA-binding transcriptional LysR family regulator